MSLIFNKTVTGGKHNRREFMKKGAAATLAAALPAGISSCARSPSSQRTTLYIVPNTHGTCAGWLDNFDTERNYCLNNYLDHLDRVKSDSNYAFVYSEVANLITFLQFASDRLEELKARVREGRVELVNAFFLESTINLSGGEAIVRLGVNGLRWYEKFFGLRPRHGWMIDVVGNHRQMPQIVAGLGLETLVFCRNNPARKTAFWWVAPDGTRMLTICNSNTYSDLPEIFTTTKPLDSSQLAKIADKIKWKKAHSPSQKTLLALASSGDYSLAPLYQKYPTELLQQWKEHYSDIDIRFCTLSDFVKPLREEIESGAVKLEEVHGDTAYCFNAFWYDLPQIKKQFRELEYRLEAAEMLGSAASLKGNHAYPSQDLYNCWIDLSVNMDRNALWGSAAGLVFRDPKSWDVEDRYASVREITSSLINGALASLAGQGESLALFNPLNWNRNDPVELTLPAGKRPSGFPCEARLDSPSQVLCQPTLPSTGFLSVPLENGAVELPRPVQFEERIETSHYTVEIDGKSGALTSLKLKGDSEEILGGPANVVFAETLAGILADPADFMLPRPQRRVLETSSHYPARVRAFRGPLATSVIAESSFYGGSKVARLCRFYHDFPRIDFETQLDLRADGVLITVDFPLRSEVKERRRGIPYGFALIDPRHPFRPLPEYGVVGEEPKHGFSDAILPAVRWSHYQLSDGNGVGLMAHGLTAHELNGSTVTLGLFNAQPRYGGWPNELMAGQGKHFFRYGILPHRSSWSEARIPRSGWEFNGPVFCQESSGAGIHESFLETSDNVIVGALRREKRQIELRFYEAKGLAGEAEVTLRLPHQNAFMTNLMGEHPVALKGGPSYRFPIKPQQIVTLRFDVDSEVVSPDLIAAWQPLVPSNKQPDLSRRILLKGHPPFGPPPSGA